MGALAVTQALIQKINQGEDFELSLSYHEHCHYYRIMEGVDIMDTLGPTKTIQIIKVS